MDDVAERLQEDRKLVAAQARDDVACVHRGTEATRHLHEHEVAGGVSERFVDFFKVFEVDEKDREERVEQRSSLLEPSTQMVVEERAVGQAGEAVVRLAVCDAAFAVLELRLVAKHADGKARVLVLIVDDRDGRVGPDLLTGSGTHVRFEFKGLALAGPDRVELLCMSFHRRGDRIAEHRAIDVVRFQQRASTVDDCNADRSPVEDGAELRLRQTQRVLGFLAGEFGLQACCLTQRIA